MFRRMSSPRDPRDRASKGPPARPGGGPAIPFRRAGGGRGRRKPWRPVRLGLLLAAGIAAAAFAGRDLIDLAAPYATLTSTTIGVGAAAPPSAAPSRDAAPGALRVEGRARVSDGDTLRVAGERVRLEGMDAPETDQTCRDAAGRDYPCGLRATEAMRALAEGRRVVCEGPGRDYWGRLIARCATADGDLGEAMVRAGWALAFRRFSEDYIPAETAARRAGAGMWAGEFVPPWDHRAEERQIIRATPEAREKLDDPDRPEGCDIKGNISANGRIYHLPGSRHYDRVTVRLDLGQRWFCSEAEALDAGWRPSRGG